MTQNPFFDIARRIIPASRALGAASNRLPDNTLRRPNTTRAAPIFRHEKKLANYSFQHRPSNFQHPAMIATAELGLELMRRQACPRTAAPTAARAPPPAAIYRPGDSRPPPSGARNVAGLHRFPRQTPGMRGCCAWPTGIFARKYLMISRRGEYSSRAKMVAIVACAGLASAASSAERRSTHIVTIPKLSCSKAQPA